MKTSDEFNNKFNFFFCFCLIWIFFYVIYFNRLWDKVIGALLDSSMVFLWASCCRVQPPQAGSWSDGSRGPEGEASGGGAQQKPADISATSGPPPKEVISVRSEHGQQGEGFFHFWSLWWFQVNWLVEKRDGEYRFLQLVGVTEKDAIDRARWKWMILRGERFLWLRSKKVTVHHFPSRGSSIGQVLILFL